MADKLTDRDLYDALSEFFLDTPTNYAYMARVINQFDISRVEDVLLDQVSPVLWSAYFSVAPEWAYYESEWLAAEVQKVVEKNKQAGFFMRPFLRLRRIFMARLLREAWSELVEECNRQKLLEASIQAAA